VAVVLEIVGTNMSDTFCVLCGHSKEEHRNHLGGIFGECQHSPYCYCVSFIRYEVYKKYSDMDSGAPCLFGFCIHKASRGIFRSDFCPQHMWAERNLKESLKKISEG